MQAFLKGGSLASNKDKTQASDVSTSDKSKKGKDVKSKPVPWIEK